MSSRVYVRAKRWPRKGAKQQLLGLYIHNSYLPPYLSEPSACLSICIFCCYRKQTIVNTTIQLLPMLSKGYVVTREGNELENLILIKPSFALLSGAGSCITCLTVLISNIVDIVIVRQKFRVCTELNASIS